MTEGSAKRDTFPYADDLAVVDAFLRGRPLDQNSASLIASTGKMLHWPLNKTTVAWVEGGTLNGKLLNGPMYNPGLHILHAVIDRLGMPGQRFTREMYSPEVPTFDPNGKVPVPARMMRYFFDGSPIQIDQPVVLCGPVGLLAYRAGLKAGAK